MKSWAECLSFIYDFWFHLPAVNIELHRPSSFYPPQWRLPSSIYPSPSLLLELSPCSLSYCTILCMPPMVTLVPLPLFCLTTRYMAWIHVGHDPYLCPVMSASYQITKRYNLWPEDVSALELNWPKLMLIKRLISESDNLIDLHLGIPSASSITPTHRWTNNNFTVLAQPSDEEWRLREFLTRLASAVGGCGFSAFVNLRTNLLGDCLTGCPKLNSGHNPLRAPDQLIISRNSISWINYFLLTRK